MTVGIDEGHDTGSDGQAGSLEPRQRHMALVVGRRPVKDGKGTLACHGAAARRARLGLQGPASNRP